MFVFYSVVFKLLHWRRGSKYTESIISECGMASSGLQPMPLFEPKADPTNTSARWTQWIERFNTYVIAANMKDSARKRALLLYQAGPEVHKIFKTLPDDGEEKDYDRAVQALKKCFEPEKNKIYQVYTFRQATQRENETIDEFHTRLRRLATSRIWNLRSKCN